MLGISLYPEHSTPERDAAYIEAAAQRGFKRIFSCLLSAEGSAERIAQEMRAMTDTAHAAGMEVIFDVAPRVFTKLGITADNLDFFAQIGADGIRLDEAFAPEVVAQMTKNPQGLYIELNASMADGIFEGIVACDPNKEKLLACHNFYPLRYTGLEHSFFVRESQAIKDLSIELSAFVSCDDEAAFGPWPLHEGLPTLEEHRGLPMDFQARHLFALGCIDNVLVSNCYPTDVELDALAALDPAKVQIRVTPEGELAPAEKTILTDPDQVVRGDLSPYMLRSSVMRVKYAEAEVPPRNTRAMKRGDVVIVNEGSPRYKGELQLVLGDMPNDGTRNVVATMPAHEQLILAELKPWSKFSLLL